MEFKERLKQLRARSGLSLDQVATAARSSKSYVWEMEQGRQDNPSLEMLRKLAAVYEVPIAVLIGDDDGASYDAGWNAAMAHVRAMCA